MGMYRFECDNCDYNSQVIMTISEYLVYKYEKPECEDCGGLLIQSLGDVKSDVYRTAEEIKLKIKKEVDAIVKKAREGDEATWRDLKGDDFED